MPNLTPEELDEIKRRNPDLAKVNPDLPGENPTYVETAILAKPISITEAAFLTEVINLAHYLGWRVAHFRPARKQNGQWVTPVQADATGFPDLVMVREERVIFAELKSEKGHVTEHQQAWLEELSVCPGIEVYGWRPSDFDRILEILR